MAGQFADDRFHVGPKIHFIAIQLDFNDAGQGLFIGFPDVGGQAIYRFVGTNVVPIVVAGTGQQFSGFGTYAVLNNSGAYIFQGFLPNGSRGLFSGPNPILDNVIRSGDILDGSTVLTFDSIGINDQGQIAFQVFLTGGPQGNRSAIFSRRVHHDPRTRFIALWSLMSVAGLPAWRRRKRATAA